MATKDTAEYSSSKAPDTRKHAEERETVADSRLIPGGAHGTPSPQGMAALDRDVPAETQDGPQPTPGKTGRPETT